MKLSSHRVLVIDDDVPFGRAVSRWLSQLGHLPTVAQTAHEGVALLNGGNFAAILLDLGLPDVGGHALLRQLRAGGVTTPVIVMSGTNEVNDVVRAWRGNAADFLHKPFTISELSAAFDKAICGGPLGVGQPVAAVSPPGSEPVDPRSLPAETPAVVRPTVAKLIEDLKRGEVKLPILDPSVARLPEFLTTEDWELEELAGTVARDANLAAGILRTANSPAYQRGKVLVSLRDACARLGSQVVVAIAFEISVKGQFSAPQEPARTALKRCWRAAIVASRVAPMLADRVAYLDRETLRLCALFHNVGELLAICLAAELERPVGGPLTLEVLAAETEALHEKLGEPLARSWKLPAAVIRLAGRHHQAPRGPEGEQDRLMRQLVLASWAVALRAGFTYFPGQNLIEVGPYLRDLGLAERDLRPVDEAIRSWKVDG